jgi:hypothetical protein
VRHVEKQLRNERILLLDPLPIQGLETFLDVGNKLAYGGESPAYRKERVCAFPTFTCGPFVPTNITIFLKDARYTLSPSP